MRLRDVPFAATHFRCQMMARTTKPGRVVTGNSFAANSASRAQMEPSFLPSLVARGATRGHAEEMLRSRNLDRLARPGHRSGNCPRDCWIRDRFWDINWLRTRLMRSDHGDSPA